MDTLRKLILIGGAGTSSDVLALIASINQVSQRYQVLGLVDDTLPIGSKHFGVPILGGLVDAINQDDVWFVDCLGSPSSYRGRQALFDRLGFDPERFETLIHPSTFFADNAQIGQGSILFPNVVVLSNVSIGHHVTVLSGSVLNHDVEVGDWSIMASGVILSGAVKVGRSCYLGAASVVREGISIGDGSLVGMGSAVIEDVTAESVVAGVPAQFLRNAE